MLFRAFLVCSEIRHNAIIGQMKPGTPTIYLCISQFQLRPAPPPPSRLLRAFARLVSPGGGAICKFCAARGTGVCQPRTFDTHAVFYQNITTLRILLEKTSRLTHLSRTGKNLRGCKGMFSTYACISSLLIKPELHSEIGSYRRESTFFWVFESNFC